MRAFTLRLFILEAGGAAGRAEGENNKRGNKSNVRDEETRLRALPLNHNNYQPPLGSFLLSVCFILAANFLMGNFPFGYIFWVLFRVRFCWFYGACRRLEVMVYIKSFLAGE